MHWWEGVKAEEPFECTFGVTLCWEGVSSSSSVSALHPVVFLRCFFSLLISSISPHSRRGTWFPRGLAGSRSETLPAFTPLPSPGLLWIARSPQETLSPHNRPWQACPTGLPTKSRCPGSGREASCPCDHSQFAWRPSRSIWSFPN